MDPSKTLFSKDIVLKIIETVGDPFLITALVVVFLMYRLLQRNAHLFDSSLKDVFNELHTMSKLLTEHASTLNTLVKMIKQDDKEHKDQGDV